MNKALPKCGAAMSPPTVKCTSLPASAAGRTPSDSPECPATPPSGPAAAPASPSRAPGSGGALTTSATSGRSSSASLRSASLQSSLASRLRARLDVNGSLEYALTWKEWATALGPPICALRARGRRTYDRGSTGAPAPVAAAEPATLGWPTPQVYDAENAHAPRLKPDRESRDPNAPGSYRADLKDVAAQLAGWPTTAARDWRDGRSNQHDKNARPLNEVADLAVAVPATTGWPSPRLPNGGRSSKDMSPTGKMPDGRKCQAGLEHVAKMAEAAALSGWRSPNAMPENRGGLQSSPEKALERAAQGHQVNLDDEAAMAVPLASTHGATTPSSASATAPRGALNPAFSRWLMGFPSAWCQAAIRASRKLTRARRPA